MFNLARHFRNAVQPLVHCALELAPAERGVWLRELRAECPAVALELERLMQPALEAAITNDSEASARAIVPGSLDHLGLRC
ncbi:hypothetical protein [Gemmatimonas sp.]|uniref:hypothetical protein n=1 Tax=Gemmatimonas sp. TaxID=1962908 RepID=UPI00286C5C76|nr:hypothetical protein [Gemmatimonas sp.]